MSKSDRIVRLLADQHHPGDLDPRYAGWFECFNRGAYFEAHEVLEDLWLRERGQPVAKFHQGLIQLAGAFVHLQKGRLRPADALFRLAEDNLRPYGPVRERLDVPRVLALISRWRDALAAAAFQQNPLGRMAPPSIHPEPPPASAPDLPQAPVTPEVEGVP